MTSLNISLPESLREYVESRVESGGFSTASEYLRDLIRADQQREQKLAQLCQDIQVGIDQLDRGQYTEYDSKSLGRLAAEVQAAGRKRLAAKTRKSSA